MKYRFNETLPADYRALAQQCNMKVSAKSANLVMQNSLFTVGIYDGDMLKAFGRVCGDGSRCFVVCDIMSDEHCADEQLELNILKEINDYLQETISRESRVLIHVPREYAETCRRFGYKFLDEDYEVVMKK
jgi:hypothetical protein